jgi:hypothetical protein
MTVQKYLSATPKESVIRFNSDASNFDRRKDRVPRGGFCGKRPPEVVKLGFEEFPRRENAEASWISKALQATASQTSFSMETIISDVRPLSRGTGAS